MDLALIKMHIQNTASQLLSIANLNQGEILVVGCSTSEVVGERIGSASNIEVARSILDGLLLGIKDSKIYLAIQCCEHLNRALVVEKECAHKYNLEIVSVIPHEKAGGSLSAVAMERFLQPVVVENIAAHAGIDIGDTFIGMHLKSVAIPVRLSNISIGKAHLTLARTRPRLIGGARAKY